MSLHRLLLAATVLSIAACTNTLGPATDCYYDKAAAAAPGNQICSESAAPSIPDDGGFTANQGVAEE